jgi:hypothetical protein
MIKIKGIVEILCSTWEEFLKYTDGTYKSLMMQYDLDDKGYTVYCLDEDIVYTFFIWNYGTVSSGIDTTVNNANYTDFVDNYKDLANRKLKKSVEVYDRGGFNEAKSRTTIRGIVLTTANEVNPTIGEITFVYSVSLNNAYVFADWTNFNKDDYFNVFFYPSNDGAVGTVTEAVLSGNNTIKVSSGAISTLLCGDYILFDKYYEVESKTATTITLTENLTSGLEVDDPVKLRIPMVIEGNLLQNSMLTVTPKTFGSVPLTAGCTMRIEYYHKVEPTSAWDMKFNLVYFYGEA